MSRSRADGWFRRFAATPPHWVGGVEAMHLTFPDDVPLRGAAAERAYARQLFVHYLGSASSAWPLAVWRYGRTRGASIWVEGEDSDTAFASPSSTWPSAKLVLPLALQWALRQRPELASSPACLVLVEGASCQVIRLFPGRIEALDSLWLSSPDFEALAAALSERCDTEQMRTVLGYGLRGSPSDLPGFTVLGDLAQDGVPAAWQRSSAWPAWRRAVVASTALCTDAALSAPRWLANAALGCSLLVFATAAHDAWRLWQQLELASQFAVPRAQAAAAAPINSLSERVVQRDLSEAARNLHRPWASALAGIEAAAAPGVHWLELAHSADQPGLWQLRGKAPDAGAAMATTEALGRQTGWHSAMPNRLEPPRAEDAAVVFTVEARHGEATR